MTTTAARPARSTLAHDSGRNIVGALVSTVCNFAVIFVLARVLGSEAVGLYAVAFALRAILSLVCGFGMRVAMTQFMAGSLAREDHAETRGVSRLGVLLPLAISVVVGAVLALAAGPLARDVFDKPGLELLLVVVGLSLPFSVLMDTALSGTRGFLTMRYHAGIGLILEPVVRLGLTLAALLAGSGLRGAAFALLIASVAAGCLAAVALRRLLGTLPPAPPTVPWSSMTRFAIVSWVASMATQGLLWADIVILGALVSSSEVGTYQVASRVLLAAMIVITPLTTSMAPRIARSWAHRDLKAVTERYDAVMLWSMRLTVPLLTGVVVVPQALLHAFGEDFSGGTTVVLILSAGALVESAAAPSAVLLNQIGRNKLNMAINLCALVGNIWLNFALVPSLGITGAAAAWAAALIVPGIVRVAVVRSTTTHRWPFGRAHVASVAAAVVAGAVAAVLVHLVAPGLVWFLQIVVAATVILVGYAAGLAAVGLDPAERRVLRARRAALLRRLATRFPLVRRLRLQREHRAMTPGATPLEIRTLVSPYRYDVLGRRELFVLAREHRDLAREDPEAFLDLVAASRYRTWFDEVAAHDLDLAGATAQQHRKALGQNVERALQLLAGYEARGFDERFPVTVLHLPPGTPVGGRSLGDERWIPLDGLHRLALLMLDGTTRLAPAQYVVASGVRPRYNTLRVAGAERLPRRQLLGFLAWGLTDTDRGEGEEPASWDELLERVDDPRNRAALAGWPEAALLGAGSPPAWWDLEQPVEAGQVVDEALLQPGAGGRGDGRHR